MAPDDDFEVTLKIARQNADLVSAIAPDLARTVRLLQENAAASVAASMSPVIESIRSQAELAIEPLLRRQQEIARQALAPLLEATRSTQFTAQRLAAQSLARSIVTDEFRQAIANAAAVAATTGRTKDVDQEVSELQRLAESDEVDEEVLATIDDTIEDDRELSEAVENAVNLLVRERPWLNRKLARRMVVMLVFLVWTALICGVSLVPGLAAVPTALGLSSKDVADRAGRKFDGLLPPIDEEE